MKAYEVENLNLSLTRAVHAIFPKAGCVIERFPVHTCLSGRCGACEGVVYRKEREPALNEVLFAMQLKDIFYMSVRGGRLQLSTTGPRENLSRQWASYDLSKSLFGQTVAVKRWILEWLTSAK